MRTRKKSFAESEIKVRDYFKVFYRWITFRGTIEEIILAYLVLACLAFMVLFGFFVAHVKEIETFKNSLR